MSPPLCILFFLTSEIDNSWKAFSGQNPKVQCWEFPEKPLAQHTLPLSELLFARLSRLARQPFILNFPCWYQPQARNVVCLRPKHNREGGKQQRLKNFPGKLKEAEIPNTHRWFFLRRANSWRRIISCGNRSEQRLLRFSFLQEVHPVLTICLT